MKASLIAVVLSQLVLLAAAVPAPEPAADALLSTEALPIPPVLNLLDLTKKGYTKCGERKCDEDEEEPKKKKGGKCGKDWVS